MSKQGFTVIELVIVLAMIAILTAIAVPAYQARFGASQPAQQGAAL